MKHQITNGTLLASAFMVTTLSVWAADPDVVDVEKFQPAIVQQHTPNIQHRWSIDGNQQRTGVARFAPIVQSYKNKGNLIASWNPRVGRVADRPTFIIVHGGHGVSPGNFATAEWLTKEMDANVLILDSYWSRGKTENWLTWNQYGANMRMLDAIAAARFTKLQGADPQKTYLYGDSQGGWTVLRTMTAGHSVESEVKSLYRGGIAVYPNCYAKESFWGAPIPNKETDKSYAPPLGGYSLPTIIFTGSLDEATPVSQCKVDKALKSAYAWHHFEGATHAWEAPSDGAGRPSVDGKCSKADNIYNHFPVCHSAKYTAITRREVTAFVQKHSPTVQAVVSRPTGQSGTQPATTDMSHEQRTDEILRELAGGKQ